MPDDENDRVNGATKRAKRSGEESLPGAGRGEEARRRLLAAGLEIFGRYGYEAASTRQIAERAETNLSAITYHFGNKAGLYNAVVAMIAERIGRVLLPALSQVNEALSSDALTPGECVYWLQVIFDTLAMGVLDISQQEASMIMPIWIREQIDPTPAFEILYENVMARMLLPCSSLMGRILNKPAADPECRVRVFSLIGQVVIFRLVRLAVLRITGWSEYDAEHAAFIRGIIRQNIADILSPLLAQHDHNSGG